MVDFLTPIDVLFQLFFVVRDYYRFAVFAYSHAFRIDIGDDAPGSFIALVGVPFE